MTITPSLIRVASSPTFILMSSSLSRSPSDCLLEVISNQLEEISRLQEGRQDGDSDSGVVICDSDEVDFFHCDNQISSRVRVDEEDHSLEDEDVEKNITLVSVGLHEEDGYERESFVKRVQLNHR